MTPTAINQTAKNAAEMFGYKPNGIQKSILALKKHKAFTGDIETYANNMIGSEYFDEALAAFGYEMALVVCTDYDKYFSEERAKSHAQKVTIKKSKVIKEQKESVIRTKKERVKLPKVAEKVIVKPHSLDSLLRVAGSITPRNTALKALQHLKITANGSLLVEATDLTTAVRLKAPAQQKTKTPLVSFVNWLDVKKVKKFESVTVGNGNVVVNSNSFKEPQDVDLPDLSLQFQKSKVKDSFFLPAETLQEIWQRVSHAISKNEFRVAMMGVYVANGVVVTTDGHRLAEYKDKRIKMGGERSAVLPVSTFNAARRVMQGKSVSVSFTDTMVRFEDCTNEVYGVLIDEQYPNYKAVIPHENENKLIIDRKTLINAVKECLPCANPDTKQVRLQVNSTGVIILTDYADKGLEARRELKAVREYTEEMPNEILAGYNGAFLLDVLNALNTETVTFAFSTPTRAALITGDTKTLHLLMPVRLSS